MKAMRTEKTGAKAAQPTALYPLGERLLKPVDLANMLAVMPGTGYSWISRGVDIPHVKISGTARFRQAAIEAWLLDKEKARKIRNFE